MTVRLLFTGSRLWSATWQTRVIVSSVFDEFGPDLTFVHGNAQGADRLIALIGGQRGATLEPHNADWGAPCRSMCQAGHRRKQRGRDYCPAAGDYRNQLMVDLGAVACLALLVPPSVSPCNGTRDCAARAKSAGIPVRWYAQEPT